MPPGPLLLSPQYPFLRGTSPNLLERRTERTESWGREAGLALGCFGGPGPLLGMGKRGLELRKARNGS